MTLEIFDDYESLSQEAAGSIIRLVRRKADAVLCLAAGDTPRGTYAHLAASAEDENVDFSRCTFIGLDEWVGIPPSNEGSCAAFLKANVFDPLGIKQHQIQLFDAMSDDPGTECEKMNSVIRQEGGIDLILVGVGMNGHIGFNEPGISETLEAHVVPLDPTTKRIGQKYFAQATELQFGITLGLKQFLESREAIMMASGLKKASVMKLAIEDPVSTHMPASIIRKHQNGVVMLDAEAASEIKDHGRR